jgi:hypothetical protein
MGITQQRIIDLTNAVLTWEKILKEAMRRIAFRLSENPDDPNLQILASMTPQTLAEDFLDEYLTAATVLARELENIRITKAKNTRRHFRALHRRAEIPEIDTSESLMERRARIFRESYGQAELAHSSDQHQESINDLMDLFKGSPEEKPDGEKQ